MYLPKSLQIVSPFVSRWYGKSGRQYEFGVVRSAAVRFDEAAVYVLARHDGNMIVPLSVGSAEAGWAGPDNGMPEQWVEALVQGMSHVHLRFEARSAASRQAEVQDLALGLQPLLNAPGMSDISLVRLSPDRPIEVEAPTQTRHSIISMAVATADHDGPAAEEGPTSRSRDGELPVSDPLFVPEDSLVTGLSLDAVVDKASLGFDPAVPLALFADELSTAAGADILLEAAITVAHDDRPINVLFVGEGPLRGELEARVSQAGLAERVRFAGDAGAERFAQLFAVADFVIIPARMPRDGVLVRRAAMAGKPVLTTHQGSADCIDHGRNGLVTYDNPGSFVWGLREFVHGMWLPRRAEDGVPQSEAA